MKKTRRVCLELDEEERENLNQMKKSAGVTTYRELLNNALSLLEWAITKRQSGWIIASVDKVSKDGKYGIQEIVMPVLTFAAKKKDR